METKPKKFKERITDFENKFDRNLKQFKNYAHMTIPKDIYEVIRKAAFKERISMAELIRKASLEYINNHELKEHKEK